MKFIFLSFIAYISVINSFGQLTKNNWLVGGALSYSNSQSKGVDAANSKTSALDISSNLGYFPGNKIAIGIIINSQFKKEKYLQINGTTNLVTQNRYGFGPFVRYYFLSEENRVNVLVEGSSTYSILSGKSTPGNIENKEESLEYSFFAGPVIFFNSSVGIEFLVGYNGSKTIDFDARGQTLRFKIGFQIHLQKE